jgi:lipopolysaccharide export system protein LptC
MRRLSSLFPLFVVGLLAAASFWLQYVVQNERSPNLGNGRHDPDAIIEKFGMDRFDAYGHLQSTLVGTRLMHFPDNDMAEVLQPHIRFLDPARPSTWTSDRAIASNSTRKVVLLGNVRGERPSTIGEPEQVITTEELTLMPDDELATTDKPITLIRGQARIDAIGAKFDNINGLLTLQRVHATLPPGSTE